jgi:type IV secretory pathway VirB9-like protein
MKQFVLLSFFPCGVLLAAPPAEAETAKEAKAALVHVAEVPPRSLTLRLGDRDIGIVHTRIRMDTWIILPPDDTITGAGSGDNENWQIKPADDKRATNLFHVQPSKANTRTNLNLRTQQGHYYSFLLIEDSECTTCQPDLKVFVEPTDISLAPTAQVGFAPGGLTEAEYKKQVVELESEVAAAQKQIQADKADAQLDARRQVDLYRAEYPVNLKCGYVTNYQKPPFMVQAICSDGVFTYVKSAAQELPTLYVEKDGKPALVQFTYHRGASAHEGTYVIDSVMRSGYFQLGKKKLKFHSIS